jgi:hypothetical protein
MKHILLTFIFISVILISCSDKVLATNISADIKGESEKDRYLAEERERIDKSSGYGYDDCYFFTNSEGSYDNKALNMKADDYFYKYNIETKEITKVFEKSVFDHFGYEGYLYCVLEDNSIVRILQTGEDETLIFKGDGEITDLYVDGCKDIRVLYFKMNDACYRYFVNEKILDKLFYHKDLYYFNPISNYKIEWSFTDPLWTKYVEETGDRENYSERRMAFLVNYDVLNNKQVFIKEQQNPKPPYNIDYLNLDENNLKSEEEIAKYAEKSIIEEIISNLIESSISITKIYRGQNEMIIDKEANEYIYKNNIRYGKGYGNYQNSYFWKFILYETFSKKLADVYFQSDMVINIDGLTYYVSDDSIETDELLLDNYSYKILSKKNDKITVELCIPYNDGNNKGISNRYTKTEISKADGKWVITYQDLNDFSYTSRYNPNTSDSIILLQIIFPLISVCLVLLIKKRRNIITQKGRISFKCRYK